MGSCFYRDKKVVGVRFSVRRFIIYQNKSTFEMVTFIRFNKKKIL
jgi:hypothetical protein